MYNKKIREEFNKTIIKYSQGALHTRCFNTTRLNGTNK